MVPTSSDELPVELLKFHLSTIFNWSYSTFKWMEMVTVQSCKHPWTISWTNSKTKSEPDAQKQENTKKDAQITPTKKDCPPHYQDINKQEVKASESPQLAGRSKRHLKVKRKVSSMLEAEALALKESINNANLYWLYDVRIHLWRLYQ